MEDLLIIGIRNNNRFAGTQNKALFCCMKIYKYIKHKTFLNFGLHHRAVVGVSAILLSHESLLLQDK
jgi:hypothetical protein